MVNKKIVTIFLLLFLITSTISCVYADDDDRSYSITQALVDIIVDTNGMLHINETFDYSFDGTFNGVYRDIPLKEGESISNIHVSAEGAYTKEKKRIIYCIVSSNEIPKIKEIALNYDKKSFISVNDVTEVKGRGFKEKYL